MLLKDHPTFIALTKAIEQFIQQAPEFPNEGNLTRAIGTLVACIEQIPIILE